MRPFTRALPAVLLAAAALATSALAAPRSAAPVGRSGAVGLPTTVTDLPVVNTVGTYPVYDAYGRQVRTQTWTVTPAGGNCCEVYVASTPGGRLLEFGGTYPVFSDDRGRTWKKVAPLTPLSNGEGAITAAPNGDIVGVGWDPYTGDHLQSFKYTAADKSWRYLETPLHTPFYDREWIGVAKGPFNILGQFYPYATVITGGGTTKEQMLISGDGLNYVEVSSQRLDQLRNPTAPSGFLPVLRDREVDWFQSQVDAGFTTLGQRGLLMRPTDLGTCSLYRLRQADASWECFGLPSGTPTGVLRQDSRGWVTNVNVSGGSVTLGLSTNGGRSFNSLTVDAPRGGTIGDLFDVKVNGALGKAIVSAHVALNNRYQDMVFVFDIRRAQPRHVETMYVGKGDLSTISGVVGALADRYDFSSVALLPDGKVAVSFDDSTTLNPTTTKPMGHSPEMAIQR